MNFYSKVIHRTLPVIIMTLAFCYSGYSQKNYFYSPKYSTILDTSKGVKCLSQCSRNVPKVDGFFKIGGEDSMVLVKNFKKLLKEKSSVCCLTNGKVTKMEKCCYQYVGVIIDHTRYIYINAFSCNVITHVPGWKTTPVIICDGGPGEWGILFEIDTASFSQLAFNGMG